MPALLGKKNDLTQSSSNDLSAKIQELTQPLNNEKDRKLCKAIYKNVTEQDQRKLSDIDRECKQLFKQGANPSVLAKLEELLIGQEKYQKYYIKNFLPALLQEITQSKELGLEKIEQILRITSNIVKQSDEYEHHIQFFGTLLGKIRESSASCKDDKKKEKSQKIGEIITEIISGSNYQIDLRNSQINGQGNAGTPKPRDDLGSRANLPVLNKKSPLLSSVSGRRGSISTTLSSVGGDNGLQREEIEEQPPKQNPEEKPKKQENENSGGQANPIGNGNPQKRNEGQPQLERPAKKEQNTQENENSKPTKQLNNRNFRIALVTCCAFSVGCLIAGVVTLGMVGAGLFVMSVVFAIAAATRYLSLPSSELTSVDLSPLIDDSKQR